MLFRICWIFYKFQPDISCVAYRKTFKSRCLYIHFKLTLSLVKNCQYCFKKMLFLNFTKVIHNNLGVYSFIKLKIGETLFIVDKEFCLIGLNNWSIDKLFKSDCNVLIISLKTKQTKKKERKLIWIIWFSLVFLQSRNSWLMTKFWIFTTKFFVTITFSRRLNNMQVI